MCRHCLLVGLMLFLTTAASAPAFAEKRVALVIGNGTYKAQNQLVNPPADAHLISKALNKAHFEAVETKTNLGIAEFRQALRRFQSQANGAEVALVYFAGHGIEVNGANWLIPTDADLGDDRDLDYEAIKADLVLQALQGARMRVLVLDACRNNPFGRNWRASVRTTANGLAKLEADDVLVLFAAAPGRTAGDGTDLNSPFAEALAKRLPEPGLAIQLLGNNVRDDVLVATGGNQRPYVSASITGKLFYLVPAEHPTAAATQIPMPTPASPAPTRSSEAAEAWAAAKDTTSIAVLEDFITRYRDSFYAGLARARVDELKKQQMTDVVPRVPPAESSTSQAMPTAPTPPAKKSLPNASTPSTPLASPTVPKIAMVETRQPIAPRGKTLQQVKSKGSVACGVSPGFPGFSQPNDKGEWTGLDADYCRAIAAAIFADATKVRFVPLTAKERFTALQSGEVDILSRYSTWTMTRDSALGLSSVGVIYYDGQGFMLSKRLGIKSAKELNGASVCMVVGTTEELNIASYFKSNHMTYKPVVFEKSDDALQAYLSARCDVYTTDQSCLYLMRARQARPEDHLVLPEIISKEPMGPYVRWGDDQWLKIARWTLFALISADEFGVTSANAEQLRTNSRLEIRRLLGSEGDLGAGLGLSPSWAYDLIKAVGNYGEVFERNLGSQSALRIPRRANEQWSKGGLIYAPPFL
jgi:general L-amino acid transport system substrate-binding protein